MYRLIVIVIIILLNCIDINAQNNELLRIDENVKLSFPSNYQKTDTLFHEIYFSDLESGFITLSRLKARTNGNHNLKQLKNGYKEMVLGIQDGLIQSKLISSRNVKIDRLICKKAKFSAIIDEVESELTMYVFMIKETSYFLGFYCEKGNDSELSKVINEIVNSIDFNNLTKLDQLEK